jgi:hypothetical protein
MQLRNEGDDDKVRACRSQFVLCQRLAEGTDDPRLAEKLRNLAEKLKAQAPLQTAA